MIVVSIRINNNVVDKNFIESTEFLQCFVYETLYIKRKVCKTYKDYF